jgi:hypothetical protein
MSAKLLEGKAVAEAVLDDVAARVVALKTKGIIPGLGTILVYRFNIIFTLESVGEIKLLPSVNNRRCIDFCDTQ